MADIIEVKFLLSMRNIIRYNAIPVSLYPPNEPVPSGVGNCITGNYSTILDSPVNAHFTFNRVNTSVNEEGHLIGLGTLRLEATFEDECKKYEVVLFWSYQTISDPKIEGPNLISVSGQVSSARINEMRAIASLKLDIFNGGLTEMANLKFRYEC